MGLLNFEHSKASHHADVAAYSIAVLVLAGSAWLATPSGSIWAASGWTLCGLAAWTLVEYLLHRFVLHRVEPFKRLHATHHQRPTALIGSPTLMTAALFALLVFAPTQAALGLWRACALTLGMVCGYLGYTIMHHGVHHWRSSTPWLQRRKRWHGLHHRMFAQPICFGVTSSLWDHVFCTVEKVPGVATTSLNSLHGPVQATDSLGAAPHRLNDVRRASCIGQPRSSLRTAPKSFEARVVCKSVNSCDAMLPKSFEHLHHAHVDSALATVADGCLTKPCQPWTSHR